MIDISHKEIQKAVKAVLTENEWPINQTYDDAGLSERSYVKFASQVITKLRDSAA